MSRAWSRHREGVSKQAAPDGACEEGREKQEEQEEPEYCINLKLLMKLNTYTGTFDVGKSNSYKYSEFVDIIGSSVDSNNAKQFARLLSTFANKRNLNFDIVVTPKFGSPILGYEFAKLVNKKFMLYAGERDYALEKDCTSEGNKWYKDGHDKFDFPKSNDFTYKKRVLIVDDSTTGGSKIIAISSALQKLGFEVSDVLVLFVPKGKNVERRLREHDLILHSITEGPEGKN